MNSTSNNQSGLQGNGPAIVSSGAPIQTLLGNKHNNDNANTIMDSDMGRIHNTKLDKNSTLNNDLSTHNKELSTNLNSFDHGNNDYNKNNLSHNGIMDNAMTRSEEVLHVGKEKELVGNASLNKYITTEHVERPITLTKEKLVVERIPINNSNINKALNGPELKESHFDMNISAERAIAMKETIPMERIQLKKEIQRETVPITAELRKEHIDVIDNTKGNLIVNDRVAGTQFNRNNVNHNMN